MAWGSGTYIELTLRHTIFSPGPNLNAEQIKGNTAEYSLILLGAFEKFITIPSGIFGLVESDISTFK